MQFHAAILAPNGDVKSNERRDSEQIAGNSVSRKLMTDFRRLLRQHLTDDPLTVGTFGAKVGGLRHRFLWQQVEPLSAMGFFRARGEAAAASFYLHGSIPEMDEAVLEATELLFIKWFGGAEIARPACRGLRSIKERPLLVVMPGRPEVLSETDWCIIGNLCPCLAAVFFERADAAFAKLETFRRAQETSSSGDEPNHIWN